MPIMAKALTGEAGRLGAIAASADLRCPAIARLRYSDQPPERCRRDADNSASRLARPDAVRASLPVQSAFRPEILAAMNRKHTVRDYREHDRPFPCGLPRHWHFLSDFIVGFPGETAEDFSSTLALVTQIGYAAAYSFKYSPRPGTPAAEMAGGRCQRRTWTSDWRCSRS